MSGEYWVRVQGRRTTVYFVRFVGHAPSPRWTTHRHRESAYCFASVEDAERVVEQLARYGTSSKVVTTAPKPPEPPTPVVAQPPAHLTEWISRILDTGLINSKDGATGAERVKIGYRMLAHECHPDVGGSTDDMQRLNEANGWLQDHPDMPNSWFIEMSWHTKYSGF
jgi:hypothetical protein